MSVRREESELEAEALAAPVIREDFGESSLLCQFSEGLKEENDDGGHGCGHHCSCSAFRRPSPPPSSFCTAIAASSAVLPQASSSFPIIHSAIADSPF